MPWIVGIHNVPSRTEAEDEIARTLSIEVLLGALHFRRPGSILQSMGTHHFFHPCQTLQKFLHASLQFGDINLAFIEQPMIEVNLVAHRGCDVVALAVERHKIHPEEIDRAPHVQLSDGQAIFGTFLFFIFRTVARRSEGKQGIAFSHLLVDTGDNLSHSTIQSCIGVL